MGYNRHKMVAIHWDDVELTKEDIQSAIDIIRVDSGLRGEPREWNDLATDFVTLNTEDMDDYHIQSVLSCLDDHIRSGYEDLEEITGNHFGTCVIPKHNTMDTDCDKDTSDCVIVQVGMYRYFGPNAVVDVYYINQ